MNDVREKLLAEAQSLIQRLGYNGFSFRDLAETVGIRSASIHYHFPTKADLGAAVAARYTEDFMGRLNAERDQPSAERERKQTPATLLTFYASLFREALSDNNIQDNKMCLCGILSAEAASLPDRVSTEVRNFFDVNLTWLTDVFAEQHKSDSTESGPTPNAEAAAFMASLQGGLILAKGLNDPSVFDLIAETTLNR